MPEIRLYLPESLANTLDRQARTLLLSRRSFIRAVLAAIAAADLGAEERATIASREEQRNDDEDDRP